MRVIKMLHFMVRQAKIKMHAYRQASFFAAVQSLLRGQCLSVTGLGRSLVGKISMKYQIKRMDRLLSNHNLMDERISLYRPLVQAVIEYNQRPVIVVDWCSITKGDTANLLRAGVPVGGRTLTVYEEVHPRTHYNCRKIHRYFLSRLKKLLPPQCKPMIVTDAGFKTTWFRMVSDLGWDFAGRVRHGIRILWKTKNVWISSSALFGQATTTPQSLGPISLTYQNQLSCHMVIVRNAPKGRIARNKQGKPSQRTDSKTHAKRNREPWLIATSVNDQPPSAIVKLYQCRMQIEESFRDLKNVASGWGLASARSQNINRLQLLLLIAAWATFVTWLMGLMARRKSIDHTLQANTITARHVLSTFFV